MLKTVHSCTAVQAMHHFCYQKDKKRPLKFEIGTHQTTALPLKFKLTDVKLAISGGVEGESPVAIRGKTKFSWSWLEAQTAPN